MTDVSCQKLSVRIVTADYYLAKPVSELSDPCYSGFRSLPIYHVPVIRIFGPTSEGVKACVHVHGVLPYLFIPNWNNEIQDKDLYQFASCLDKAINTSFAYSSSKTTHVYRITSVLNRPFYGYYEDGKKFLKIEFYNPAIVKRAADLLLNGAVFNNNFQPHAAHVPYILQFFIDHNLYGMSHVTLSSYRERQAKPSDYESGIESDFSSSCGILKQSYTSFEVDSSVSDVVNEFKNADDMPNNPGLAFIWMEERKRRRLQSRVSQITPSISQVRPDTMSTRSEQYFKKKLLEKLMRFKVSQDNLKPDPAENDSVVLEEEANSSYEELNTQSRSILKLLAKMTGTGDQSTTKTDADASPPSSPSIVFSDDEMEPLPFNASTLSSQPLLKLPAEDDSILGTNFSDDDVDEDDHLMLSQSLFHNRPNPLVLETKYEDDEIRNIDQLDGASRGTTPPPKRRGRRKNEKKTIVKKPTSREQRAYDLRPRNAAEAAAPHLADSEETHKPSTSKSDSRFSPKKIYPQLQIDTQKSPRSGARTAAAAGQERSGGPSPESFVTSFAPAKLLSPTASAHSEGRKSESKRPYPQLEVNIKTSPRTGVKSEPEEESASKKATKVLKKRKIDFDAAGHCTNLDMSLMTTRWKKQFGSKEKKSAESGSQLSRSSPPELAQSEHREISLDAGADDVEHVAQPFSPASVYTISNEIGSQKYSLKIRLDSCGPVDELELLKSLLTKTPVVKIEKLEVPRSRRGSRSSQDCECSSTTRKEPLDDTKVGEHERSTTNGNAEVELSGVEHQRRQTRSRALRRRARRGQSPASSHGASSCHSSGSSRASRRAEGKSSSEIDFFDVKKNGDSSEAASYGEKIASPGFGGSIKEQPSSGDDPSSCGSVVAPSRGEYKDLVSRSGGTSEDGSVSLRDPDTQTSSSRSSDGFPFAGLRMPEWKFEDSGGRARKYSAPGDDLFTQSDVNVEVPVARAKNDQETVILSRNSGTSEDSRSSFSVADFGIHGVPTVETRNSVEGHDSPFVSLRSPHSRSTSHFNWPLSRVDDGPSLERRKDDEETVILSRGSGTSEDSDSSLGVADPCPLKVRYDAVRINRSADSDDFAITASSVNRGTENVDAAGPKYSELNDDHFSEPDAVVDRICPARGKTRFHRDEEAFLFSAKPFGSPPIFEDENLAAVRCSYDHANVGYDGDREPPSRPDGYADMYSSVNDDEFPEPSVHLPDVRGEDVHSKCSESHEQIEVKRSLEQQSVADNLSDSIAFCNSDEDEAFANLDLNLRSAKHDRNTDLSRNREPVSSPEPLFANNETSTGRTDSHLVSPNHDIIATARDHEAADTADDCSRPGVLVVDANAASDTRDVPGAEVASNLRYDNSIWDSLDESNGSDDEHIRSFYSNKSIAPVDATLFCDSETQSEQICSAGKVSTPPSADEIMSFYDSESSNSVSDAELKLSSLNKKSSLASRRLSDEAGSPVTSEPGMPHSTPQSARKKKSPSPTYTPIMKKLMLKNMARKERGNKSRMSSQRFQSQPFLADINEEDERKGKAAVHATKLSLDAVNADANADQKSTNNSRSSCNNGSGEIDVTLANTYGFRMNLENLQDVKADVQHQFITVMSMEVFATTRGDLNPDPEYDPVLGIFYSIFNDDASSAKLISGMIIVASGSYTSDVAQFSCDKVFVKDENELLDSFIALIRKWDPDMFVGYEVEMSSWGYLIQRGQLLGRNFDLELSRLRETKENLPKDRTIVDESDYSNDLKLVGRIVLNVWRLMRHEIALQSYSFENMIFHILHQRVPHYSFRTLTEWWRSSLRRWIVVDHYAMRAESNILLLQQLDFIGRTSELARLFGIQFYEVLSRGSQFRVESMMLRLAKTRNFVAVSPSTKQRAAMRAPESLPLIMEPESKFYTDPVIVLDFQSLYPSIIIAYNYCFSTCLGRVEYLVENETFKFGCVQHTVPINLLTKLQSSINISPCGVAFVDKNVRTGVLPSMLQEILDTRLMVKKSMKENKDNSTLQRVLHARQLGLKLIANVTYGYTSANFSGRMPCIEVGDSVVSKGRETLERAIEMITNHETWDARVIYGDTDSLFVLVPNRTKEEAFRIGAEIVDAVSNVNPKPVKLKLEKVYYPCILQTKKRYVGYMYESADQKQPVYDAKGIETVRRDGCPAVSKILEKSLKLLFERKEIDVIKQYVQRQFSKLMSGRLNIQELTFAREYRGLNNYKPAACVPALQLAKQAVLRDRRSEPRVKERVRYVLTAGPPGVPLIRSVKTPQQFLDTPGAIINAEYYITRVIIPALERCFSLLNVDVRSWYAELPRRQRLYLPVESDIKNKAYKKKTISHYFAALKCIACQDTAIAGVCKECQKNPQKLALILGNMVNGLQRKYNYVEKICRSCCGRNDSIKCSSLDCPLYYTHRQTIRDVEQVPYLEELQQTFLRR